MKRVYPNLLRVRSTQRKQEKTARATLQACFNCSPHALTLSKPHNYSSRMSRGRPNSRTPWFRPTAWLRTLLVIASVAFYAVMAPFGYAFFALLVRLPTRHPERRSRLLQHVVWRAFGLFHDWLRTARILDFDPRAARPQLPGGTFVVVANHPTLTDATALLATVPNLCTAVRSDIFHKPMLRPLLAACRNFDAGVDNPLGAESVVDASVQRLKEGQRVLIFPEGTRSPPTGIRRFGRSAFEAAVRAQVPIVALLVEESPRWLSKGGLPLFGPPAVLPVKRLEVLRILNPADFSGDSRQIRDYIENLYRERLAVRTSGGSLPVGRTPTGDLAEPALAEAKSAGEHEPVAAPQVQPHSVSAARSQESQA